jgi:hypothetical protein
LIVVYFFVFSPEILIAIDCCGRSLSRTSLRSIPSIKLIDCCIHANFIAVKHFARSRLPSQVGSFVRANIATVELAGSRASSRLIQLFAIIVTIELTRLCDHHRDRTAFLGIIIAMDVRATIVAAELVRPSDFRRSQTSGSQSSLAIERITCNHHCNQA